MPKANDRNGHGFGTAPVFLAAISTILGAILFLRFGYAVGHTGLGGAVILVLIAHAITIPTGLAVAEIATNLRVRGGGEYFIISRSFGSTFGGAIGVSLYVSQAVSVAFYLIAFAEAFRPLFPMIEARFGFVPDARMVSLPVAVLLCLLIAFRGANIGVNALWIVVVALAASLGLFFLGGPTAGAPTELMVFSKIDEPDSYFRVFAIVFPAFTGMTAGVGLSGDLRNPQRSIPIGTLAGTLVGLVIYLLAVVKLAASASPEELAADQFIMSRIALWGPIIPIGLGAATLSSALGSILVAPRTLQALAGDKILPSERWNGLLVRGRGASNEPRNATLLTAVIVVVFVGLGNVNFVAQIISMFFMITYGALCSVSFLEHFAGNPSYRPTFRTKWYISLVGAVASFVMMFQMAPAYAGLAVIMMIGVYLWIKRNRQGERDLAMMIRGVLFQLTRLLQVLIQQREATTDVSNWRPSFLAISKHSLERLAPFDTLRWISHYYGFGSFIHFIEGPLNFANSREARRVLKRLVAQTQTSNAGLYVDTIISPTFKTAVAQIVQIPGIAGMDNNSILFEFAEGDDGDLEGIVDSSYFAAVAGFNICILRSGLRHFGYRKAIDIWLTPGDYRNASLMVLLAYIMLGHPDWREAEIRLFDTYAPDDQSQNQNQLDELIAGGRLPISPMNVQRVPVTGRLDEIVARESQEADLVIAGLSLKKMRRDGGAYLMTFRGPQDVLFVRAGQEILITEGAGEDDDLDQASDAGENPAVTDSDEQKAGS